MSSPSAPRAEPTGHDLAVGGIAVHVLQEDGTLITLDGLHAHCSIAAIKSMVAERRWCAVHKLLHDGFVLADGMTLAGLSFADPIIFLCVEAERSVRVFIQNGMCPEGSKFAQLLNYDVAGPDAVIERARAAFPSLRYDPSSPHRGAWSAKLQNIKTY